MTATSLINMFYNRKYFNVKQNFFYLFFSSKQLMKEKKDGMPSFKVLKAINESKFI